MKTIAQISDALQFLFGACADQLARETGLVRREVKVTGSKFAQTLVLGFLGNPTMSYRQMSQAGALSGLYMSAQGLEQKFSAASAQFMQRLLERTVQQLIETASPCEVALLQRFGRIYLQDSSVIGLPEACAGVWAGVCPPEQQSHAALKLHVELEYKSGRVRGPVLAPGREHDQRSPFFGQVLQPEDLRLTDLGFFNLERLQQDSQAGGFWIIRYKHEVRVYQNDRELRLLAFLRQCGSTPLDLAVQVGKTLRVACRLIAIPAEERAVAQRRRRLREYARKKQVSLSAERLALAHWTLILTNVPPERLSLQEVYALLRLRWQIELLFRLWKTYTRVDESLSANPWRILTELYAKLMAVLIQHWLILASVWQRADRSCVQAALTIQKFAVLLHLALQQRASLEAALTTILQVLQTAPALLKRQKQPATFQILQAPGLLLG
jgi:hypothetical protein